MSTWDYLNRLWDQANAPSGRSQVAVAREVAPSALAGADMAEMPAPGQPDWVAQSLQEQTSNGEGTDQQREAAQRLGLLKAAPGKPGAFFEAPFSPANVDPRVASGMTPQRRPAGGGGGGAPRNPDPYGIGAANMSLEGANQSVLAGYDTAANDTAGANNIEAQNLAQQGYEEEGASLARMGREQELQQQNELQQQKVQTWVDESARLNEQLSQEKIDPAHFFADKNLADKGVMIIGGILGGLLSVQPGQDGRNHYMDQLNSLIERDVRTQESNLANKRSSLSQRDNLLGQYLKVHGDMQMAKMQASDRLYQSTLDGLQGRMKQSGSALVQARGKLAIDQITQAKNQNQQQLAQLAAEKAQQQAAAAMKARAAAAGAARAAEERAYKRQMEERKMSLEERKVAADEKKSLGQDDTFTQRKYIGDVVAEQAKVQQLVDPLVSQIAMKDKDGKVMLDANGRPMVDPDKQLDGVSPAADLADSAWFRSLTSGKNVILSDQGVKNRQIVKQMGLAYRNMITGAGGNKEEAEEIRDAFIGARTTAEVNAAIQRAQELSDKLVANAKAAAGPRAASQYESNMNQGGGARMPGSFTPAK